MCRIDKKFIGPNFVYMKWDILLNFSEIKQKLLRKVYVQKIARYYKKISF